MHIPEWIKPGFWGLVSGAIVAMIVGFNWGGWVTGGAAQQMAAEQTKTEVAKVLVPICLEQSRMDPARKKKLEAIEKEQSYGSVRGELMLATGWATMPGSKKADPAIADACMSELAKSFKNKN
ncbi:hypothetical protein A3H65_00780 [Candidatus Giovannonibacteria bacterium RIFCSPLOWO2_02_FULL_45_14]|nr:MAG: hypothetical protein A3E62_01555 [Candidatus Giovannonibacteria bacterium RIFCSPHIGHO2_12_FULL_44_29]OGF91306.1 MAG: hypothetical protein A3H65_00780 [Candidatus Giovannonibacteria bacterium RIFCSPLOWO2_02_FULL_45_14]